MTNQQEKYGLQGFIGGGNGQIAGSNSGSVFVPCVEAVSGLALTELCRREKVFPLIEDYEIEALADSIGVLPRIETIVAWGQRVPPFVGTEIYRYGSDWSEQALRPAPDATGIYLGNNFVAVMRKKTS